MSSAPPFNGNTVSNIVFYRTTLQSISTAMSIVQLVQDGKVLSRTNNNNTMHANDFVPSYCIIGNFSAFNCSCEKMWYNIKYHINIPTGRFREQRFDLDLTSHQLFLNYIYFKQNTRCLFHYSDATWASLGPELTKNQILIQNLLRPTPGIKDKTEKVFPCHNVIMFYWNVLPSLII